MATRSWAWGVEHFDLWPPGNLKSPAAMIYLLRHGDAERGEGDDATRRLTAIGKRQAKAAGEVLAKLDPAINTCFTSPKLRAIETARLSCEALGIKPRESAALASGGFDPLELAAGQEAVLLVGHEPHLSQEVGRLTGARLKLRKGGIAVIDGPTLIALLRPGDLRWMAACAPPAHTRPR
jgi:phosphohistidine phosphatase